MSTLHADRRSWSWTRSRIGFATAIVVVLLAGAWAVADDGSQTTPDPTKHDKMDIIKCKDYVCTLACGDTQYTHGLCVDGSNRYPITIQCCCCTGESAKNRYFIGG